MGKLHGVVGLLDHNHLYDLMLSVIYEKRAPGLFAEKYISKCFSNDQEKTYHYCITKN